MMILLMILDTDEQKYTSDTSMAAVQEIVKSDLADAVTLRIACTAASCSDEWNSSSST